MVSAGDAIKAFYNANLSAGVQYAEYEFYPDWDSEGFIPEDIVWTKTGGSDARFTINPSDSLPTKPSGFVLRAVRGAAGGAGTSASVQGLTSSGRTVTLQFNMAQYFNTAAHPTGGDTLVGNIVQVDGSCVYGSGTVRTAELFVDGLLTSSMQLNTSGSNLIAAAMFDLLVTHSVEVFIRFTDAFGRRIVTNTVKWNVVPPRRMWVEYGGKELTPGVNPNSASGRFSGREVKQYEFVLKTDPPSASTPVNPVRYVTDASFNSTRCRLIPNTVDDYKFIVEYPANAAAGSGGVSVYIGDSRYLVEWSAVVPARPALTEMTPGTATPGMTVTRVDATNWTASLALSGGAKAINAVGVPSTAGVVLTSITDAGDTTVAVASLTTNVTYLITPKKVGTSTVKLNVTNYSGDPDVILNIKITVT